MIRVSGLTKVFSAGGEVVALHDIRLDVDKGDIYGIIGMSGAGKSTLLRCIGLLETPTQGSVVVDGKDTSRLRGRELIEHRKTVGIIFQGYNLLMQRTVADNVSFPLELSRTDKATRKARVAELLELVGLSDKANSYPSQLSGGQKQRVALARTLVMKPRILLLDEPLSALDGVIKESIKSRIKTIAREYNLTTIIVTHDPEEALTLSDRVLILNEGGISQYSTPREIISSPSNSFVKQFILNQLEIKRNNILSLFEGSYA